MTAGRRDGRALACVLGCLLLLAASSARAGAGKGTSPAGRRAAKLLSDGIAALAVHDYVRAGRLLADAYRARPQPMVLFYLGAIAFAEGRTVAAHDLMRRYLADPQLVSEGSEAELQEAGRILRSPLPAHGRLSIVDEPGTLVGIDGQLVGGVPLSRPLLVTPGKHVVTLSRDARQVEEAVEVPLARNVELRHHAGTQAVVVSQLPGVLLIDSYGDGVDGGTQAALLRAIDAALTAEHCTMVPREQAADAVNDPQLVRCLDQAACQARLAARTGVDLVLIVQAQARPGWRVAAQIVDAHVGDTAAQQTMDCADCDAGSAAGLLPARLGALLPTLLAQARGRGRASLRVSSSPPGAEVRVNGRLLGGTPLAHAVWAGAAQVEVALAGYPTTRRDVEFTPGPAMELSVDLDAARRALVTTGPAWAPSAEMDRGARGGPSRSQETARRAWAPYAWGAGGAGAALTGGVMLGLGISALVYAGRCADGALSPDGQCVQTYHTGAAGGGLTVVGALLLAGGGATLALSPARTLFRRAAGAPTRGEQAAPAAPGDSLNKRATKGEPHAGPSVAASSDPRL